MHMQQTISEPSVFNVKTCYIFKQHILLFHFHNMLHKNLNMFVDSTHD